jgi:hypothetical protein
MSRRLTRVARRHRFESLEDRRLLACEVFIDDKRTLFVRGDAAGNNIAVRGGQDTIIVTCDGSFTRVPSKDIDSVQVKGGDGNDKLSAAAIAAALHLFGDDGDDSINYDVDDDGPVKPDDTLLGGGGHDAITIDATALADIIKILGTGNQVIPDPEITVSNAAGATLAHLSVQETEAIAVNTLGGDDDVTMRDDDNLLGDIEWTIDLGAGSDQLDARSTGAGGNHSLLLNVAAGQDQKGVALPAIVDHLRVAFDHGDANSDRLAPMTAEMYSEDITSPFDDSGDRHMEFRARDFPGSQSLFFQFQGGRGRDQVDLHANSSAVNVFQKALINTGRGDDSVLLDVRGARATSGINATAINDTPETPAVDIDVNSGGGSDSVKATVQDLGADLHLDADLGAGADSFTATVLPDTSAKPLGPTDPCVEFAIFGGSGADSFMLNAGDPNSPPPDPEKLLHMASELEVSFDGGGGSDSFLIGLLNVAIDGGAQIAIDGGAGADVVVLQNNDLRLNSEVHIGVDSGIGADEVLLNLSGIIGPDAPPPQTAIAAASAAALDIDIVTGDGADSVAATVQDIGIELHLDANLGAGQDAFAAVISPDSRALPLGPVDPCIDFKIAGDVGNDAFTLNVGNAKTPGPDDNINAALEFSFDGGGGADVFLIGMLNVAINGPVAMTLDGGGGSDAFTNDYSLVEWRGPVTIAQYGGDGNDAILIGMLNVAHPGGANIVANGGDGQDALSITFGGSLQGQLDVTLDGADGNDAIDAVFNLLGQGAGTLNATLLGNAGNDKLRLLVVGPDRPRGKLLIDGGAGKDTCQASPGVTVVNCEK